MAPMPHEAPDAPSTRTVRFSDVAVFLWRGALPALVVALVAGMTAFIVSSRLPPTYRTSVTLVATNAAPDLASTEVLAPPALDPAVYRSALVEGDVVARALSRVMGEPPSEVELEVFLRRIRVSIDAQEMSSLVRVQVDDSSPEMAAALANAIATELVGWDQARARQTLARSATALEVALADLAVELAGPGLTAETRIDLEARRSDLEAELERVSQAATSAIAVGLLAPLRTAPPPERAIGPRLVFNTFVAIVVGLLVAYGLRFILVSLDPKVLDGASLARTVPLQILAAFTAVPPGQRWLFPNASDLLRVRLLNYMAGTPLVIGITSPTTPQERARVAVWLSESFARSSRRTLLVDADLRSAGASAWLDVNPMVASPFDSAVGEGKAGTFRPVAILIDASRSFDLAPSSGMATSTASILERGLATHLEQWRRDYDVIVLDLPPLLTQVDGLVVAPQCDAVLLCANASTSVGRLADAARAVESMGTDVPGIVLTGQARTRRRPAPDGTPYDPGRPVPTQGSSSAPGSVRRDVGTKRAT